MKIGLCSSPDLRGTARKILCHNDLRKGAASPSGLRTPLQCIPRDNQSSGGGQGGQSLVGRASALSRPKTGVLYFEPLALAAGFCGVRSVLVFELCFVEARLVEFLVRYGYSEVLKNPLTEGLSPPMQTTSLDLIMKIETLDARTLTDADAWAIGELLAIVWPNPEKPAEFRRQQMLEMGRGYTGSDEQAPRSFIIREAGKVIAHSAILPRTIGTSEGKITIAGLARVCANPSQRGRGLGAIIAKAALEVIDSGAFPCSLFQTSPEVRPFYEKLGACVVENPIVNSLGEDPNTPPFKDKVIMRYPSNAKWPEGEIDLRGPGY